MKKYQIIYCDVPFEYDRNWDNDPKNGGITYPTLTLKDICDLPINKIADKNAILFFWTGAPKVPQALEVIKSWNFNYKTFAFVWTKINKSDGKPRCGLGHWTRSSSEIVILATKGSPKRVSKNVHQSIQEPIGKHSAKPLQTRDRIIELMGPNLNAIELFARTRDSRFDCVGNDISGLDIRDELQQIIDGTWIQK